MIGRCALTALALGTASAQVPLYTELGALRGDRVGAAVAALGDVDADGHDDFAVGAPGFDGTVRDQGRVLMRSGRTGAILHSLDGTGTNDRHGFAVGSAGDVDGDGRCDVIVGAIGVSSNGSNSGAALVYSGATGSLLHAFAGSGPFEVFGWAVAGVGDADGDGHDDVAVGAPGDRVNGVDSGSVSVFSGASGARIAYFAPSAPGDQFGRAIAAAGDVDADGHPDLVVGSPLADTLTLDGGLVQVFSVRAHRALASIPGDAREEYRGWSVAGCGDIDGDNHSDWIVGSPFDVSGNEARGSARVYSGRNRTVLRHWVGTAPYDRFGESVASAGDFDADGAPDLLVAAPGIDGAGVDRGGAFVLSGATGRTLLAVYGTRAGDGLGSAVSGGSDVRGNGHGEVIIGAGLADGAAVDTGLAAVYGTAYPRPNVPTVRRFGAPCASSHGALPRIDVAGRPARGDTIDLRLRSAPVSALAALNLGVPRVAVDLSAVGAPACTMLVANGSGFTGITSSVGTLSRRLWIPSDSTLVGSSLHAQWVVIDGVANSLGAILSDGAEIRPGT